MWFVVIMHYSGYQTEYGIKLIVLGDGESKSIDIDLSKEPIGMNFQGNNPVDVFVKHTDGEKPTCTINNSGVITLTYQTPLAIPMEGSLSPRSQLDLILLYEELGSEQKT
jgi:hypothetical protein